MTTFPATLTLTITPKHVLRAMYTVAFLREAKTGTVNLAEHDPIAQALHDVVGDIGAAVSYTRVYLAAGAVRYDARGALSGLLMPRLVMCFEDLMSTAPSKVERRDTHIVRIMDMLPCTLTFERQPDCVAQ